MLIQDDALRSVIARTLRVKEEELTEDFMKELIHLEVQDHEIATLEGLQYAENLETLLRRQQPLVPHLSASRRRRHTPAAGPEGSGELAYIHGHQSLRLRVPLHPAEHGLPREARHDV